MGIAEELKQAAMEVYSRIQDRTANIQSEYEQAQAEAVEKKAKLDAQIDAASGTLERFRDFQPLLDGQFLCPQCWVTNGKQNVLTRTGQNFIRCLDCHFEL